MARLFGGMADPDPLSWVQVPPLLPLLEIRVRGSPAGWCGSRSGNVLFDFVAHETLESDESGHLGGDRSGRLGSHRTGCRYIPSESS